MRLSLNGRGVSGCCIWYLISVIRGSPGLPFLSDLRAWCEGEELKVRILEERDLGRTLGMVEVGERERVRKDCRRGETSWRIEACEGSMVRVVGLRGGRECEVKWC
jgi:hypothetical protein